MRFGEPTSLERALSALATYSAGVNNVLAVYGPVLEEHRQFLAKWNPRGPAPPNQTAPSVTAAPAASIPAMPPNASRTVPSIVTRDVKGSAKPSPATSGAAQGSSASMPQPVSATAPRTLNISGCWVKDCLAPSKFHGTAAKTGMQFGACANHTLPDMTKLPGLCAHVSCLEPAQTVLVPPSSSQEAKYCAKHAPQPASPAQPPDKPSDPASPTMVCFLPGCREKPARSYRDAQGLVMYACGLHADTFEAYATSSVAPSQNRKCAAPGCDGVLQGMGSYCPNHLRASGANAGAAGGTTPRINVPAAGGTSHVSGKEQGQGLAQSKTPFVEKNGTIVLD